MSKNVKLDDGFEEVPLDSHPQLDEGFEEVSIKPSLPSKAASAVMEGGSDLLQDAGDAGRGLAQGALMGGEDEIVGGLQAAGDALTGKVSDMESLKNLYRQYQEIEDKKNKTAQERSPWLYGAGEVGGTVGSSLLTGGAALEAGLAKKLGTVGLKEALAKGGLMGLGAEAAKKAAVMGAAAAPYGAIQGALGSDKTLGEGVSEDAASGALSGGVLGAGIGLAGAGTKLGFQKAGDAIKGVSEAIAPMESSPMMRQMKRAYEMGISKIDPTDEVQYMGSVTKAGSFDKALARGPKNTAANIADSFYKGDGELSSKVGQVIDSFIDDAGNPAIVDLRNTFQGKASEFIKKLEEQPTLGYNADFRAIVEQLNNLQSMPSTARSVMETRDNLRKIAEAIKVNQPTVAANAVSIADSLVNDLRTQVPGYKEAAKELADYRTLFGETILGGDLPAEYRGSTRISRTKDADVKILGKLEDMVTGVGAAGTSGDAGKQAFGNFIQGLQELQSKNPGILERIGVSPETMETLIKKSGDESATISGMRGIDPHSTLATAAKKAVGGSFTRKAAFNTARTIGVTERRVKDLGLKLSQATDDELGQIAMKLPGTMRDFLTKAIENKDIAAKNAAVFMLMQNPEYRKLVTTEDITGE